VGNPTDKPRSGADDRQASGSRDASGGLARKETVRAVPDGRAARRGLMAEGDRAMSSGTVAILAVAGVIALSGTAVAGDVPGNVTTRAVLPASDKLT
jgi:hypothetical protein